MVTPHLLLWSAVTLGIIQTWRFFKRSRLITKTPYSSSLLHYLRYLFKASVLYYTSVTEIHTDCCGLNPSTMMLLTCCLIWLFNMVQSELALESQVKDVSCFLNSLTVCTCIIPGTTVPELSLACWFWTTSLHFFFYYYYFFFFYYYLSFDSLLPGFSNEDLRFCAGAAVSLSDLQDSLSF